MTLWRLELARTLRTHRGLAIVAVYAFFGLLGPVTAAYINEILARFATEGMQVTVADPIPLDGIIQFVSNASQLGLLGVVIIAAAALAVDARPEVAAFLRTRVRRPADLVVPRYVVATTTATVALITGTVVAVVATESLIGDLPLGRVTAGTGLGVAYLAFAISVVAAMAGLLRSQLAVVFGSIVVLLALPLLGIIEPLRGWLPSSLLMSVAGIVAGEPASEYLGALGVSVVVTAVLLALAIRRVAVREH